jgi:pimeloyl-ACP methyl ester carboxylesterase
VLRLGSPLAGRLPTPRLVRVANLGNISPGMQRLAAGTIFAPMWRGVLEQLQDWTTHDAFRSRDARVDYRAAVAGLRAPLLVVGGTVDPLAPLPASEALYALAGSEDRQLARFGRAFGHLEDYGHGDLVLGLHAHQEVYPVIEAFLQARATPMPGP